MKSWVAVAVAERRGVEHWLIHVSYPPCSVTGLRRLLGRPEERYLTDRNLHLGDAFSSENLGTGRYPVSTIRLH